MTKSELVTVITSAYYAHGIGLLEQAFRFLVTVVHL
jgi:hypothetical protein